MITPHDTDRQDAPADSGRQGYSEGNPLYHTANLKRMLQQTVDHARDDVLKVNEPKAQALFETTAEVLEGLLDAYEHYEQRSEPAWR